MPRRAPTPAPAEAFIEIDGRRWRTSDPKLPPSLRQELVNELMAARRAVGAAADDSARRLARGRVNDAKVALGERGRAWWLPRSEAGEHARIQAAIRALLRSRRGGTTICPSDAARIVDGHDWRRRLSTVRTEAAAMAARGEIVVTRGGTPVQGDLTKGVLRYRLAAASDRQSSPRRGRAGRE